MEKQEEAQNGLIPAQEDNKNIEETIKKIKKTCMVYFKLPFYMKRLIETKNSVKAQFIKTKKEEKRVEYLTLYNAVDKELTLHQYRLYREDNPDFTMCDEERKLLTNLPDYIEKLFKKNLKNRLCYIATGEFGYKVRYKGIKRALKTLVAAMDARFRYDIVIDIDYATLKMIHRHLPLR